MKLYHFARTRSDRTRWALEELCVEYEPVVVDLAHGEQHTPDYRTIHPVGLAPALMTDEGVVLRESAAIVMYLVDQHPDQGLAPVPGSAERGAYYEWCVYGPAELDPFLMTITRGTEIFPAEVRDPVAGERAKEQIVGRLNFVADTVSKEGYILGTRFSAADIVIGHACAWARMIGISGDYPALTAYLERLGQRPAFRKIYESET